MMCVFILFLKTLTASDFQHYISFTLCPAYSKVGRGNLRYSVFHAPPNFGRGGGYWMMICGTRSSSTYQSEDMKITHYLRGNRTHNRRVYSQTYYVNNS